MTIEYFLVGATIATAIATWYLAHHTKENQRKEYDRGGMLQVFEMLSNEANKKIRRKVYEAYCNEKISKTGEILDPDSELDIEEARTIFGRIGRMIEEGYIPKFVFLDTFAGVVIRVYKSLENNIRRERTLRESERYMEAFTNLYNDAERHWKIYYKNDPFPDPCSKKTKEIIDNRLNLNKKDQLETEIEQLQKLREMEEIRLELAKLKNELATL